MYLDSGLPVLLLPRRAPSDNEDPGWVPPLPAGPVGVPHVAADLRTPCLHLPGYGGSCTPSCAPPRINCAPAAGSNQDAAEASDSGLRGRRAPTPAHARPHAPSGTAACLTIASTKAAERRYTFMTAQLATPDKIYLLQARHLRQRPIRTSSSVGPAELAILTPGVWGLDGGAYYFKSAVFPREVERASSVATRPGRRGVPAPGVAFMYDGCNTASCNFNGNSGPDRLPQCWVDGP